MLRIISALILLFSSLTAVADTVKLADNAPDSYTIVKGDTLWDISGRFLKQPWRWPEVWRLNREQIKNPHWIYPGQVIYLDRNGPYLSFNKPGDVSGTEKLGPKIYQSDINPIPSVPLNAIDAFLTQPLVVQEGDQVKFGTIVATEEGRLNTGSGDTIFAKNIPQGVDSWQVYRRAEPIVDPVTNKLLGYEALYLGTARVMQDGNPATLQITSSDREIGVGDRLVPAVKPETLAFVPHAPQGKVEGRIVRMHDNLFHAGKYAVVGISAGRTAGLEPGHVLAIYRTRAPATYDLDGSKEHYDLPEQRIGLLFVFRVFDQISYGLIVESDGPVKISDMVRQP
jgi:hypothetical protein